MSLTVEETIGFFLDLWKTKTLRNGVGVDDSGKVTPFYLKELLVDDETTPTKGYALIETGPTVEMSYRTAQHLDLSKAASSDFLFTELYYNKDHMVFGYPKVKIDDKQGKILPLNDTSSLTIRGEFLVSGFTLDFPPEVTVDSMEFNSLEEVKVTFTNTYTEKTIINIHALNGNGEKSDNTIIIEFA